MAITHYKDKAPAATGAQKTLDERDYSPTITHRPPTSPMLPTWPRRLEGGLQVW